MPSALQSAAGEMAASEAARQLGVSTGTLYGWIKKGIIPRPPIKEYGLRSAFIFTDDYLLAARHALKGRRTGDSRLFRRVLDLFGGDAEAAQKWLNKPQPALGGATAESLSRTERGVREVEDLIGRIEHGVIY